MGGLSITDWLVLGSTLAFIVIFGIWKSRGSKNVDSYLLGGKVSKWWTIGLSVMATQASAITFLSTPGQAYADGMRFVQFYFGLPIAMVILCIFFIPIYYRLKVYTAYEYLESRFDLKTRKLAAFLFLVQRGLGAGITIYAPSIILSTILGWDLNATVIVIGSLVIIYTVSGGTKAVSQTQKLQMLVILVGMGVAFYLLVQYLPESVSFRDALYVAGASGKLNAVDFSLDFNNRYTFWSGITGGLFLALAYFGTDQSQVQRYLTGQSIRESRLGLLFNAALKVPMQFFILLTGIMVFLFYQFHQAPVFFNQAALDDVRQSEQYEEFQALQDTYDEWFEDKQTLNMAFLAARDAGQMDEADAIATDIKAADQKEGEIRNAVKSVISEVNPEAVTNDTDYVFISFILEYIPKGLIGLLLAVIFSAAMSSTAAELNALGSTTVVDFYRRSIRKTASDKHYVNASMVFTLMWGVIAIFFAIFGTLFENLIQFVNIVGSLFYGTILGIFLIAFFLRKVGGQAVFISALVAECLVFYIFIYTDIGYLWYNVIGCGTVMILSIIIESVTGWQKKTPTS